MNVGLFLLFTTLGTLIWNIVLVNLGASLGNSWEVVVEYMGIYSKVIYVVLLLLVAILLYLFIKRRR